MSETSLIIFVSFQGTSQFNAIVGMGRRLEKNYLFFVGDFSGICGNPVSKISCKISEISDVYIGQITVAKYIGKKQLQSISDNSDIYVSKISNINIGHKTAAKYIENF